MKKLSTLFIALLLTGAAYAQVPNGGFENWTSHGTYSTPDSWATGDSAINSIGGTTFPCEKGTPGHTGSSYIKLTTVSVTISSFSITVTVPGAAVSGKMAITGTSTFSISSGFAISSRPANLIGFWQYVPQGTDQGSIMVLLTKWNTPLNKRDTISFTNQLLSGSVSSWTSFVMPLTYMHGSAPDTGIILLLSGKTTGGTVGSYLYLDDLDFSGTVPNGVVNVNNTASSISIFPNPATSYANVSYHSNTSGSVKISIVDLGGKSIKELDFVKIHGDNDFPIDVTQIAVGMYFVKITDDNGTVVKKLVIE